MLHPQRVRHSTATSNLSTRKLSISRNGITTRTAWKTPSLSSYIDWSSCLLTLTTGSCSRTSPRTCNRSSLRSLPPLGSVVLHWTSPCTTFSIICGENGKTMELQIAMSSRIPRFVSPKLSGGVPAFIRPLRPLKLTPQAAYCCMSPPFPS